MHKSTRFFLIMMLLFLPVSIVGSRADASPPSKSLAQNSVSQPERSGGSSAPSSKEIKLRYASFDPQVRLPGISGNFPTSRITPGKPSLYLIQFTGPILPQWQESIVATGALLYDYIPEFAYLARLSPEQASAIANFSYVRWVGPFQPIYKVDPSLLQKSGKVNLIVSAVADAPASALAQAIISTGASVTAQSGSNASPTPSNPFIGHQYLNVEADLATLPQLAAIEEVTWIEERLTSTLDNDQAAWVIQSKVAGQYPIWQVGITGAGPAPSSNATIGTEQIVAVADNGIDMTHVDFQGPSYPNATILGITNWGAAYGSLYATGTDGSGHGSHIAGTVAGSGTASGGETPYNNGSYKGMAYGARIYMQQLGGGMEFLNQGPTQPVTKLMTEALQKGAHIQSNSWGDMPGKGVYNSKSQEADQFMWDNKDFLGVFAAGNDGYDTVNNKPISTTIEAPATAKDVLTVGAANSGTAFDILATFSSRGPTADGRIKPDLTAPGTLVWSVAANTINGYTTHTGTSMATPVVSGAAALLRDWYINRLGYATPQSALLKATLINSSDYMTKTAGDLPNNNQGWGRILLQNVIQPPAGVTFDYQDNTSGLSTSQSATYVYTVTNSTQPLKITLAWTDAPGSTAAATQLVNDLDLTVTAPDGTTHYIGNNFTGRYSNANSVLDRLNNVEGVTIQNPTLGTWTVQVNGYNIPHGPQPFALAITGPFAPTTNTLISSANPSVVGYNVTFTATVNPQYPSVYLPSGTVSFNDGTTLLGSSPLTGGIATFSTSTLTLTTHPIQAVYGGDTLFGPSNSAVLNEEIVQACLSGIVTSSSDSGIGGSCGTLSLAIAYANSQPPAGNKTVTFAVNINTVTLSGSLPHPGPGVTIDGGCTTSPGVTIDGNGVVAHGLYLDGGITLKGLAFTRFLNQGIVATTINGTKNILTCVKVSP
ncbi:MAG: S8 family serine peptidase [Chloroflexota bacterium]